ncbi:MAG: dihydrodipicolinate synthase family protein, partial [Deltaproteobacteria bacterium]|nr:dihydrodipicolinate synthase family protein [Deltaproteobacteria bacterium]
GRTGCDMLPATIATLADHPKVAAVKEATGSIARGQTVIAACAGKEIDVLSGDDATAMALTMAGGNGVISVVSNIAPNRMASIITAANKGQMEEACELNYQLLPLMDLLFVESNPIPVKAAMAHLGFGANELRLPLCPLSQDALEPILAEMAKLGIVR